jgi:16S rRNA (adenine1518-N6/adenine1519-N6)-dimethyltransferase
VTEGPAASRRQPLDPRAVRMALRAAGLRARRSLSQNFLADVEVLEAILAEAAPETGRRVLEIGPGLGILTGGLLEAGAAVTAVELDDGLAAWLAERFAREIERGAAGPGVAGGLTLIHADALDLDLPGLLEPPYDVVANLPYHVTSPTLHAFLGAAPRPERLVLMVQREVAERLASPPGGMSYLSVFVQYHAEVRIALRVPPEAFEPAPAVESAVVVIEPRGPGSGLDRGFGLGDEVEEQLWRLVQAGFRERRKMLHNVLTRQLPVPPEVVAAALAEVGIAPDRRPQTLSVEAWIALQRALGPLPGGPTRRSRTPGRGAGGRGPRRR